MRATAIGAVLVSIASANATEILPQRIDLNPAGTLEQLKRDRPNPARK